MAYATNSSSSPVEVVVERVSISSVVVVAVELVSISPVAAVEVGVVVTMVEEEPESRVKA